MAGIAVADREQVITLRERGQWSIVWRRFRKHKLALIGSFILLFLAGMAFTADWWTPYDPIQAALAADVLKNAPPGYTNPHNGDFYILGTDFIGRDVLSRLAYGGQISLSVGFICTIMVTLIGMIIGSIAGFFGGFIDTVLMRLVDLVLSLPFLPTLIAVSIALNVSMPTVPSYWKIVVIITILGWGGSARLVRAAILSLRNLDFVEATRALGAGNFRIIARHLLPNALAPLIVETTLNFGAFIVAESSVSFLGFGINKPVSSWGNILTDPTFELLVRDSPLQLLWPNALIFLAVLSINFIGDALRDALDPRLKM